MKSKLYILLFAAMMLASCASQKSATDNATTIAGASAEASFVKKVIGNAPQVDNIVGSANVTLKFGEKSITVPGSVHMRKDQVIRIQLSIPLLGSEIGRLEFTPDYVLVMDRINKQYVKGDYNQLDFLRDNGITFYSLQALFWNQLTSPGKKTPDVQDFRVDTSVEGAYIPVTVDNGKMKYKWSASRTDGTITSAVVSYNSTSAGTSMLSWLYSNFMQIGKKRFPATQDFTFQTYFDGKKQQANIKIQMSEVKNSSDWETETTVSSKYKKVEAESVFTQLMGF